MWKDPDVGCICLLSGMRTDDSSDLLRFQPCGEKSFDVCWIVTFFLGILSSCQVLVITPVSQCVE